MTNGRRRIPRRYSRRPTPGSPVEGDQTPASLTDTLDEIERPLVEDSPDMDNSWRAQDDLPEENYPNTPEGLENQASLNQISLDDLAKKDLEKNNQKNDLEETHSENAPSTSNPHGDDIADQAIITQAIITQELPVQELPELGGSPHELSLEHPEQVSLTSEDVDSDDVTSKDVPSGDLISEELQPEGLQADQDQELMSPVASSLAPNVEEKSSELSVAGETPEERFGMEASQVNEDRSELEDPSGSDSPDPGSIGPTPLSSTGWEGESWSVAGTTPEDFATDAFGGAGGADLFNEPSYIPPLLQIPDFLEPDNVEEQTGRAADLTLTSGREDTEVGSESLLAGGFTIPDHAVSRLDSETRRQIASSRDTAAADEPILFSFQFRQKSVDAPTPEEAAAQHDWVSTPSRVAHIGRRSELGRTGQGRGRPGRPHAAFGSTEELSLTGAPGGSGLAPIPEMEEEPEAAGEISLADETPAEDVIQSPETMEDGDAGEERSNRSRRRKDRNKSRRRERNGSSSIPVEEVFADASLDEIEEAPARSSTEMESRVYSSAEEAPVAAASRFQDEEQAAEAEALARISLDQRLGKEIFVNTGTRETRIAYLITGQLTELHLEREERLVGAIAKARVDRILPGLDAAFVDIGLERNAFLMAGDVTPEDDEDEGPPGRRPHRNASIVDLVKPRQEIMVQVTKAPHSTKGARVSTRVSLPGRYLVLMPDSETVGVSRKIDDDSERDRLKKIARQIRPSGFGVIVRTEAENKTDEELRNDVEFLLRLWGQIQQKHRSTRNPSIVHRDLSLSFKIIRDLFGSDVNRFVIDSRDEYEKVLELVDLISPKMRPRVILYEDPQPLFERLGIEAEIERLFRHKVWLKSGGWLAIDQTEALTTIDVNSGKYVGTTNPAQTIFKINMEAVTEICRQLRLRDIGGMIILDLIDMSNPRDRAAIMKALEVNLKKDRSRTKIAHLSPLGLVEMTRKRSGETFSDLTTELCSYCGGRGRTLNPDTVSILAEREIKKQALEVDEEAFLVMVNSAVAPYLIGPDSANVDRLEREIRRAVYVRTTDNLHIEKYEVVPVDMQEVERQLLPYREGQVLDCVVEQSQAINLPHAVARLDGYLLDLTNGGQYLGRRVRARLVKVGRSMATAEVVGVGRPVDKLGGM